MLKSQRRPKPQDSALKSPFSEDSSEPFSSSLFILTDVFRINRNVILSYSSRFYDDHHTTGFLTKQYTVLVSLLSATRLTTHSSLSSLGEAKYIIKLYITEFLVIPYYKLLTDLSTILIQKFNNQLTHTTLKNVRIIKPF